MSFFELLLLAAGLAMDAFAVSVTHGMCFKKCKIKEALVIATTFGFFQALMPILGYLGGSFFYQQIKTVNYLIAFALLTFLGIRMIIEGIKSRKKEADCEISRKQLTVKLLFLQGIATSIDALAAGLSLSVMQANIVFGALVIGLTTTVLCFVAVFAGRRFGTLLNDKAEIFGGLILIAIGVKILLSHLV